VTRLVIDPVTRVGGQLRVEAELSGGAVGEAWLSATSFRGIESVLRGRPARDAWLLAQRVCGSCTGVHALASVRAVENALGVAIPKNARLVRNLMTATTLVQEHVLNFYLRELPDWADPAAALTADPAATSALASSISDWPNSGSDWYAAARDRLGALIKPGASGPFAQAWTGHPAYRLPPEVSLMLYGHYLEALDWQRQLVRIRTILGGKSPHPQTYLVGGMAIAPQWGGPSRPADGEHPSARHSPPPLSPTALADIDALLTTAARFVNSAFAGDVMAVAAHYPEWQQIGRGIGHYLSFGEFAITDGDLPQLLLARGRVMDRDFAHPRAIDQESVAESVDHAWYEYTDTHDALLHPAIGLTRPRYAGPALPYSSLAGMDKYSWTKAPRYADDPMEVGPLARLLVAYGAGNSYVTSAVDRVAFELDGGMDALFSTAGRMVARAIEAQLIVARMGEWLRELVANLAQGDLALVNLDAWDPARWPSSASGFGLAEGPRGAIGHWLTLRDGRIADYQIVDGSTWNGSPRDNRSRPGACEQALVGTPIADPNRPLEVLRTIHSFAVCPACAVH
jgi:Ni,Fe-hydrogenase I large subunit